MNDPGPSENAVPAWNEHATARGRLLLARLAATLALFVLFEVSGLSRSLLAGLDARFAGGWWPVHLIYLTVTLLGLGALLFPIGLYEDFVVEARERGEELDFDDWLPGSLRDFAVDLVLGVAFFGALCGLVEIAGAGWWIPASVLYGALLVGISIVQRLRGPPPDETVPLGSGEARAAIEGAASVLGIRVDRIECWRQAGEDETAALYVVGIGRQRRIVVTDVLLADLKADELHAYAVQELASVRAADVVRGNLVNIGLSLLAFAAAEGLFGLAVAAELAQTATPARFPLFAAALLVTTFAGMPLAHAYSRHRVHEADRATARLLGAGPLRRALEKVRRDEPETAAAAPFDLLLHAQPSIGQRIARLARLEKRT